MTPDQLQQVVVEISAVAAAVFGNGVWRKRTANGQQQFEAGAVERLETEGQLMREQMKRLGADIVRLEVRMELGEKVSEQHRVEMHSLSGRVEASNALYTEMLEKAKAAAAKIQAGNPVDIQDQTKLTVKKEERS